MAVIQYLVQLLLMAAAEAEVDLFLLQLQVLLVLVVVVRLALLQQAAVQELHLKEIMADRLGILPQTLVAVVEVERAL
jgi:hypothetical protein